GGFHGPPRPRTPGPRMWGTRPFTTCRSGASYRTAVTSPGANASHAQLIPQPVRGARLLSGRFPLAYRLVSPVQLFQLVQMHLDRLAHVEGLGPAGARSQVFQSRFLIVGEPNGQRHVITSCDTRIVPRRLVRCSAYAAVPVATAPRNHNCGHPSGSCRAPAIPGTRRHTCASLWPMDS